jgi:hypothetical protein
MQDLNQLPNTPEEDEAMRELFEKMGQDLTGKVPVLNISDGGRTVQYQTAPNAPAPQPSEMGEPLPKSQVNPEAVIDEMLYTIKQSLLLLATVINQPKAQPNTTPPEGDPPSLQETIELTLQQADWFEKMVQEAVAERVESEIEDYFYHRFDPSNFFDFGDAISNEVHDRIDDAVRDHIDDAVADKVEEAVVERMNSIRVVFD